MKVQFFKTVILTAGVFAAYHFEYIEKQTFVALFVFILGYFFGIRHENTKRVFRKETRKEARKPIFLNDKL